MKKISYNEIDSFIREIDNAYLISNDSAYNLFKTTEIEYPKFNCHNPLSDEFRNNIFDLYKQEDLSLNQQAITHL